MEAARVLAETTNGEPVLEDWLMKRNCSASPRQFVLFYASLASFSLVIATLLMWRGLGSSCPSPESSCWLWVSHLRSMLAMRSITNASGCIRTGS